MTQLSEDYKTGWRDACRCLEGLFTDATEFYIDQPQYEQVRGIYERAASIARQTGADPELVTEPVTEVSDAMREG